MLQEEFTFKLRFVGKLSENIKNSFISKLGNSVEFIDFVPHKDAISLMFSCNVLLALIPKSDNNKYILPGKIFEYLASGRQVLAIGPPDSTVAKFVKLSNAGAAFDYDDTEGIRNFLLQQYDNHRKGIYPTPDWDVIEQFSRQRLTQRLAEIIQ